MKVFVTGASGFVGSAVVQELLKAGHQVRGLARSDEAAQAIEAAGAEVFRGSIDDPDSLTRGATGVDGVIHTAYNHDFSQYEKAGQTEAQAIAALGKALAGSNKPLVTTSGLAGLANGRETDESTSSIRPSEPATLALVPQGVRAMVMRLASSVHDAGDHGFVPYLIQVAREKGKAAYIGDGQNCWAAVHRLDAAHLYRLALEQGEAGSRYHGVGEAGIPFREIAEEIGRRLRVPVVSITAEEAPVHLGWMARFAGLNLTGSSALTQQRLGWQPTHMGLLADMDANYFGG
ncbi:SDR family oxidoreductase [Hymenobacter sp. RP-2-7]|uniref:SDR family oxidoreductase n=1 Tax=Hymenobacter polaris TaxID=2682546 RepID=A0A7Y0FMJ2_9BACT|nr:SDR family oxidoreductase [Hymenobacter polaris]NML65596.1 SDR family oxidoreductase [Hymenobacter polaris]